MKNKTFTFLAILHFAIGWGQSWTQDNDTTVRQTGTIDDLADYLALSSSDGFSYASTDGDVASVISEYRVVGNQGNKIIIEGTQTINAKTDLLVMDDYVGAESAIDGATNVYMEITGRLNLHDFHTDADGNTVYNLRTALKILQQQQNTWGGTSSANNMVINDGVLNITGATLETDGRIMVAGSNAAFQLDNGKIIWQQPFSGSTGGIWFRQENPTSQSNGGTYIRNGTMVGAPLQTYGGAIEIDGITFIDAPFCFQFGQYSPAVFEARSVSSIGNDADIPFYSNGVTAGRQVNLINTDLGTDLKVKGQRPNDPLNYGTIIVFQEFKIITKDLSGNPIAGSSFIIKSTDNGNRKSDNRSGVTSYDFAQDFVNVGVTDANGEYEGLYNRTAADNNALVVGEYVKIASDSSDGGEVNTGENQPRRRGKVDSDVFDVHFFAYGYLPATQATTFRSLDVLDVERVMFVDNSISQTDKSIVDAYTEIETLDQLYDRSASWKVDNVSEEHPSINTQLVEITGTTLDFGDQNLTIDANAASAFTVDTSMNTITIKASNLSGSNKFSSIRTTGNITLSNGAAIEFGYEDSSGRNIYADFNWGTSDAYDIRFTNLNDQTVIGTYTNQTFSFKDTFLAPSPFGSGVRIEVYDTGTTNADSNRFYFTTDFTDSNALTLTIGPDQINADPTGAAQHEALFLARKILQKTESMTAALDGTMPTLTSDGTTTTTGDDATKENQEAIRALLLRILTKTTTAHEALKGNN